MQRRPEPETPKGIACPLHIAHSEREITCKSYMVGSEKVSIKFDVRHNKEQQYALYCCGNYKYCEQYLSWKHFQWQDD